MSNIVKETLKKESHAPTAISSVECAKRKNPLEPTHKQAIGTKCKETNLKIYII